MFGGHREVWDGCAAYAAEKAERLLESSCYT